MNRECLSDGELRAMLDLGDQAPESWRAHLAECAECRGRQRILERRALDVARALDDLEPESADVNLQHAWTSFQSQLQHETTNQKQGGLMTSLWTNRTSRLASVAAAVVAVVIVLGFSPMRSVASDFMNRFQVEEFEAVTFNVDDFDEFQGELMMRALGSDLDKMQEAMASLVELDSEFDTEQPFAHAQQYDSVEEAEAAYGADVPVPSELPEGYSDQPQAMVSEATSVSIHVDTASLQTIVDELDLGITALPDPATTPTMTFTVDIPKAAGLLYPGDSPESKIVVAQLESPTLTTPPELDMNLLRDQLLELPGLPESLVDQLQAIENWEETLIVPVPSGYSSEDVTINDEPGLLIAADDGSKAVVVWEQDGLLHLVGGDAPGDALIDVANSLQ